MILEQEPTAIDLLLAYYADDFTGSTDALEALASHGIETVLFVEPPSDEMLRRYSHVRAIGVAGQSRTMSPAEMGDKLPDVFRALQRRQPRFMHYKVCSTFDSSPEVGSIGKMIEIGCSVFENRLVPLVVAAPSLQRYCVFGNLFARSGLNSEVFRLDRHPTMLQHPVTPMKESDLREHLSRQTALPVGLIDVLALARGDDSVFAQLSRVTNAGEKVVLFDTLTMEHLATVGKVIGKIQEREDKPLFVAGSSGVESALTTYWRSIELASSRAADTNATADAVQPVDRILVISGSCSPVTGRQIHWGVEHGCDDFRLDTAALCASKTSNDAANVTKRIISTLNSGRSAIVHTCCGPNDPRFVATETGTRAGEAGVQKLGVLLGQVLRDVVDSQSVRRVAVFGGDTSGCVARSLGIDALEYVGPLEPGAPLCRVRSHDDAVDGLELVFKGGQVGYDDFLGTILHGRSNRYVSGGVK